VVFDSVGSNLVRRDTNNTSDVFVRDRVAGTTSRVSVRTGGGQANQDSFGGSISADGRYVVFESAATNLDRADTNEFLDVYVHDRQTGRTTWVSAGPGRSPGDDLSHAGGVSTDGRFVMFESFATNLLPGRSNGKDVYVRDLRTGRLERVSIGVREERSEAEPRSAANGRLDRRGRPLADGVNGGGSMSADGRLVTFVSAGTAAQVYLRDRVARTTTLVSAGRAGAPGDRSSAEPSISPDGRLVAFESFATNLVPRISPDVQVYVRDLRAGRTVRVSAGPGGAPADAGAVAPACGNRAVAFASAAGNLVPGPPVEPMQLYLRQL
jgi:Tol biopolymer transport system component